MEQDKRQKEMARYCALDMCGSIACAGIRTTKVRDIERFFTCKDERDANARKHDALVHEPWGDAHCCFQDVCKRLEMVVRLRDLNAISNELDNRAYHRNERMGVCDAGTDDHERKELEVDAAGERADDSHECDTAGDSMGDACMELWAGAGDLVGRGTYIPGEENKGRIAHCEDVGYWPAEKDARKYSFSAISEKALSDFREQNKKCHEWLRSIPMSHHQREEEIIRNKIMNILNVCFGGQFFHIHDSETLIRRMIAEGFKVFSLEGTIRQNLYVVKTH